MKAIILILILIAFMKISYGQKVALLSTDRKNPILYTDSITVSQVSQGYFPVAVSNFDTLYANLKYLNNMMSERQRIKMQSFSLIAGSTKIEVSRVPYAYGDRYTATAITNIGNTIAKFILADHSKSNKSTRTWLTSFMKYIFDNNSYFKGPNEITPVITEVVVITDK